jgi:hypothetical protein
MADLWLDGASPSELQDWIHLGDATSAQFLEEPGYPEVTGGTNHLNSSRHHV